MKFARRFSVAHSSLGKFTELERGFIKLRYFLVCIQSFNLISGKDVVNYLQGITTNDVTLLTKSKSPVLQSTLFLTGKSRIFSDAFLYKHDNFGNDILIDCPQVKLKDLEKLLKMYKLRSDVKIENVSDQFKSLQVTAEVLNLSGSAIFFKDPRKMELGWRALVEISSFEGFIEKLRLAEISKSSLQEQALKRYRLGVCEGIECIDEFALELKFDKLNSISFSKGCYTGQELIARTHFQGQLAKSLYFVSISAQSASDTSEVIKTSSDDYSSAKFLEKSDILLDGSRSGKLLGGVILPNKSGFGLALLKKSDLGAKTFNIVQNHHAFSIHPSQEIL